AVGPQVRGEPGGGVGEVGVADLVVVEAHRHLACVIGGDAPQRGRDVHPGSSTTASAWPLSTWSPGCTCSAVSTPSSGAATVCSIFIASSTTSGCPAATCEPTAAATRSTDPGIGASREPAWARAFGSGKRGTRASVEEPVASSTYTAA